MTPLYMLDTNICICILADAACEPALRLQELAVGEACVSAITFAEFALGHVQMEGKPPRDAVIRLFDQVPVMPFDRLAAARYAELPVRRKSFDRLIGAHARALGAVLVTNDRKGFADIPGLVCENWAA